MEELAVGVGHAEQLADHHRGYWARAGLEQVHRGAVLRHRVPVFGGDFLDPVGELTHPADGELPGEQLAVAGVLGRVDAGEVADRGPRDVAVQAGERVVHELVPRGEPRVAEDGAGLGVTGDQPAAVPVRVGHAHKGPVCPDLAQLGGRVERAAGGTDGGQPGEFFLFHDRSVRAAGFTAASARFRRGSDTARAGRGTRLTASLASSGRGRIRTPGVLDTLGWHTLAWNAGPHTHPAQRTARMIARIAVDTALLRNVPLAITPEEPRTRRDCRRAAPRPPRDPLKTENGCRAHAWQPFPGRSMSTRDCGARYWD
ncbi:hypothetical protein AMETH_1907 [Amycolatopsis methanolica 239]|uniref:Uncharacterized protein n=1 Tax=Amycolatopsis methanolica 239 TaxID=1068978 RepID=A0A076MMT1_AMYME|nr:hypothetical protein AMETH_1907 [Amycolatopsis methanolica 239]